MKNDFREMQQIYEAHFYQDLDDDAKNHYYSNILEGIQPFVEKCHKLATKVEDLSYQIESLTWSEEYKNVEEMINAYTENPKVEMRDIIGFLIGQRDKLKHCADDLANETEQFLTDIFTGQKIQ